MSKPLNELTATEVARGIRAGKFTSEAVIRACLERISERENLVGAWATVDPDVAINAARDFDRSGRSGPLGGVPFGAKDIIDSADLPTELGTPIHQGRDAGRDATCIALSHRAGGVLLGKTVTTEFANLHPGKTRNPHDTSRTPGGSSSGSAAAVADLMVPLALGTQTTGSTIRPSSFCGVFGFRPTYGEHRLYGVMEASGSVDTLGICARSVEDIALYRDVLLGTAPVSMDVDPAPPRIGYARTHLWDKIEPSIRAMTDDAVAALAKAGAEVTDVTLPERFEALTDAHRWITSFEFARNHAWEIDNHWDEISDTLRGGRIDDGLNCSFEKYIAMQELAERCRIEMDDIWNDYDIMLTPAAISEAPVGWNAFVGADIYKMWTVLHVPVVSLPVFKGPAGLPVSVQLFGRRHNDRKLFGFAEWVYRRLS